MKYAYRVSCHQRLRSATRKGYRRQLKDGRGRKVTQQGRRETKLALGGEVQAWKRGTKESLCRKKGEKIECSAVNKLAERGEGTALGWVVTVKVVKGERCVEGLQDDCGCDKVWEE